MKRNRAFSLFSLILPIAVGLGVIVWMFMRDYHPGYFDNIQITGALIAGIIAGFLLIIGRDTASIARYHMLADGDLSWKKCFYVNTLCEFTSAITPSSVGGSSLIVVFLNREGIKGGRSLAIMMLCIFFDELVLVVGVPITLIAYPKEELFGPVSTLSNGLTFIFLAMYILISLYTLLLYLALFRCPKVMQRFFLWIASRKIWHRWHSTIERFANEMLDSAIEMKDKHFSYWCKAFLLTLASWLSRYLVVNALIFAFGSSGNQLLALARQLVLWITQTISPTPGGSGVSEYVFQFYYADFFSSAEQVLIVTFIWRIITFYLYLILGTFVVSKKIQNKTTRNE